MRSLAYNPRAPAPHCGGYPAPLGYRHNLQIESSCGHPNTSSTSAYSHEYQMSTKKSLFSGFGKSREYQPENG